MTYGSGNSGDYKKLKGQNIQSIYESIDPLMDFNPPFIDVTFHREEYFTKQLPDGTIKEIKTLRYLAMLLKL